MHAMNKLMGSAAFVTALLAGAAVSLSGAQAATVINGSFENVTNFVATTTPPASATDDTMRLLAGSTAMPGWTVVNSGLAWIGPSNTFGLTASNGSYFLDLTDYTDTSPFGGVSQSIATVSGTKYLLSFDLGSSTTFGTPSAITAQAGSTSGLFTSTLLGSNNWETETLLFTATGPFTVISLTGASGDKYIGLDNVNVTAVGATPLPAALPLFAGGLGVIGLLARRRRRKNAAAIATA
jgi:hypothetical protein